MVKSGRFQIVELSKHSYDSYMRSRDDAEEGCDDHKEHEEFEKVRGREHTIEQVSTRNRLAWISNYSPDGSYREIFVNGFSSALFREDAIEEVLGLIKAFRPECETVSIIGAEHQYFQPFEDRGTVVCEWVNPNTGTLLKYITLSLAKLEKGKA